MNNITRTIGKHRFYPYKEKWLPSVTTIIDVAYPKSPFLLEWQLQKGKEEAERIVNEAAESGTKVHEACEQLIKGFGVISEGLSDKEAKCVQGFVKWCEKANPVFIATEHKVYCDEKNGYAGTVDIIAEVGGVPYIIDIKTSNSIYPSHEVQVAAYAYAYSNFMTKNDSIKGAILHVNSKAKQGFSFKEVDIAKSLKIFNITRELFHEMNPDCEPRLVEYPKIFKINVNKYEQKKEAQTNYEKQD